MTYRFKNLSLDPQRRELSDGEKVIHLQPRVFDVLHYLVQNRDRVVSKDELMDHIWPGVVVVEGALQRAVSVARTHLREACGDECIQTYQRQGYRFVAEVDVLEQTGEIAEGESAESAELIQSKPSIVVLPFENLSSDPEQDFFAEGITEDISTGLSRLRCLFVISRATSVKYKNSSRDLRDIAADLGVRYVLSGSVRKSGARLRVTVELMDMKSGLQIWSDRYDRRVEDIFEVQDDITGMVVAQVEPEFSQFELERTRIKSTDKLDAWEAYQRGVWHLYQFTRNDTHKSLPLFERAAVLDPYFAPAYAGISFFHFSNAYLGFARDRVEEIGIARSIAEQGVRVDNQCPSAHWALGRAQLLAGNLGHAIGEFEKSIDLNPNFAQAFYMLGWAQLLMGDPELAFKALDRAEQLSPHDPLMFAFKMVRAQVHFLRKDYERALEYADQAVREPNAHEHTYAVYAAALVAAGLVDRAKPVAETILRRRPDYSCEMFRQSMPYRRHADVAAITERLERIGISRGT